MGSLGVSVMTRLLVVLLLVTVVTPGWSLSLGQCGTQYSLCGTDFCPECCPGLSCSQVEGDQRTPGTCFRLLDLRYSRPTSRRSLIKLTLTMCFRLLEIY